MKAVNVDDVLKILHEYGAFVFVTDSKKYSEMVDKISNLPELKPKTGHWIPCKTIAEGFTCSECRTRYKVYPIVHNYCPHCGVEMKGELE